MNDRLVSVINRTRKIPFMNRKLPITAVMLSVLIILSSCGMTTKPSETSTASATSSAGSSSAEAAITEGSTVEPFHMDHTFNPHCLSQIYVDKYGEQFKEDYFKYCDAILAGADSVECSKPLWMNLFQSISRVNLPIVSEYCYNSDEYFGAVGDGVYELTYSIPKDEYLKKVDEFKSRVENLIERAVLADDSELEKALALYISESARIDYDYDAMGNVSFRSEEGYGISPYRAIMTDKGICQETAGCYAYLLLQVGIDAITCGGITKDSSAAHEWTLVKLDGKYYHCDPTYQCSEKFSVNYFGMNDAEREKQGDWDMPYNNIGDTNEIWQPDFPPFDDSKFEQFWTCYNCLLDREENKIFCYDNSGTEDANYFTLDV